MTTKITLGATLHEDIAYAYAIRADPGAIDDESRSDEERTLEPKLALGRTLDLTDAEARGLVAEVINREGFDCNQTATYRRQANRLYFDLGLLAPHDPQAVHFGGVPRKIIVDGARYEWRGWS